MAIFTWLLVTTNCWPSGLLTARAQDLAPPSRQVVRHWSPLIAPRHGHRATKTGFFSDSVPLDVPRTALLNPALQGNGGNDPLWTFTCPDRPRRNRLGAASDSQCLPDTAGNRTTWLGLYKTKHQRKKRNRWAAMRSCGTRDTHDCQQSGQTPRSPMNALQHL